MKLITAKSEFAVEFLDLPAATSVPDATWEDFQIAYLNNTNRFSIEVKARQIAWSFTAALDAVVDAILHPGTPHIFVSINLDEAREKIRYAKAIVAALDEPVRPELVRDSTTEIEFTNGSRLLSHPCRPPRGKARARIYLDEMAHYKDGLDREIYVAALPATVKGDGYIRVGSSPLGAKGLFWEIVTESMRPYPGYIRSFIPWWEVGALCTNVERAAIEAPGLLAEDRVREFGTPPLVEIFENMFLEDFQQEYECAWVDESTAWITWEIIQANQDENLVWWHAKSEAEARQFIPEMKQLIRENKLEQALVGGIDIGRKKDLSEFIALGKGDGKMPLRFMVSLDKIPYDDQEALFWELITELPFTKIFVDQTGLGGQLAENLERTGKAEGVNFTNATKELWAVEARIQAERRNTPIPMDRELAYQIHSIKKTMTAAKNQVYDTERNEKHHCYSSDTEILTDNGWVSIEDVGVDDRVATLNNGILEFEHPIETQSYEHSGNMIQVKNKQVNLLVTPNHRMFVQTYYSDKWKFVPASELLERPRHRWRFKKNADWLGDDSPEVPLVDPETYARLLGYYLSEGCKGSGYKIIFYQKPGRIAEDIIATIKAAGKENIGVSITKEGVQRIECYWKDLYKSLPDGVAKEKRIPRNVMDWSPRLLFNLLETMIEGDGSIGDNGKGQWVYYTTSIGLANDLTELLLRIGWAGTIAEATTSEGSWNTNTLWRVNINRKRLTPALHSRDRFIHEVDYEGKVYCVTVPNHLVYVRRNGCSGVWCGNSDKFWAWALAIYAGTSGRGAIDEDMSVKGTSTWDPNLYRPPGTVQKTESSPWTIGAPSKSRWSKY